MNKLFRTMTTSFLLLAGLFAFVAQSAQASHYRSANLSWKPIKTPAGLLTGEVEFQFRFGVQGSASVGQVVPFETFAFGDGGAAQIYLKVVANSPSEGWYLGDMVQSPTNQIPVRRTYPGVGPYTAGFSSCCRIGSLNNGANGSLTAQTIVKPFSGNSSPVSNLVPIVNVPPGPGVTFTVPAQDPDGDTLRFRLATPGENGGVSAPPNFSINSSTGQVTWNNVGLNQTSFWTAQIIVEDLDLLGGVKTRVPVDFLLKIGAQTGAAPDVHAHTSMPGQAQHGPITVTFGTPVSFVASADDTDAGQTVTLNTGGLPSGATMTPVLPMSGPGNPGVNSTFNWTPVKAQIGSYVISYSATDNTGLQSLTSITVNVINNATVANLDSYSTNRNVPLVVPAPGVLANDTDQDNDPLTATLVSAPSNGTLALNSDGSFTYAPTLNFVGTDSFRYKANDGTADSNFTTVTITVNPSNDSPVAANGTLTTDEDTAATGTLSATDVDGDALTYSVVANGSKGTATITDTATGAYTYTPNADANGTDSFRFKANDGTVDSNEATVNITVTAVNDAPVVSDQSVQTPEDTSKTITITATDPDGDPLYFNVVTGPTNGTLNITSGAIPAGGLVVNYTPDANYNGSDTFTYTVSDRGGMYFSGNGHYYEYVQAPGITWQNAQAAASSKKLFGRTGYLATITSEEENRFISAKLSGMGWLGGSDRQTEGVWKWVVGPEAGQIFWNGQIGGSAPAGAYAHWNFPYEPNDFGGEDYLETVETGAHARWNDLHESLSPGYIAGYTVEYGGMANDIPEALPTAKVTISVTPVNDAPAANDDTATVAEDGSVDINVKSNDTDVDGDTLTAINAASNYGIVTINANGTIKFTPNANYNGPVTVSYTLSDGNGGTDTATVAVTVTPVNDAPVAVNDAATVAEDGSIDIGVLANDTDIDGGPLSVSAAASNYGTAAVNANGTVKFTPNVNFNGTAIVSYSVSDGQGGSDQAIAVVTVTPVNDAPVANNDVATVAEDSSIDINVKSNDTDIDSPTLSVTAASATNGTATINADGTVKFTPTADYHGPAVVSYTLSDGNGGTDTATVAVTVTPVNDAPVAVNDAKTTQEDEAVTINAKANDTDIDGDTLHVSNVTQGASGSVVLNPDGTVTYTPNADFNGTDTFTYTISDGNGGSDATVTVTINAVNDAPVAANDAATVAEDGSVNIDVRGNDSDIDGDTLTVTAASATHGTATINPDGTIKFTPVANYHGAATVSYTISDGNGETATASVQVTVTPVNDAPVAENDAATVAEDGSVNIDVLANDSDVDGDTLSVIAVVATRGTASINADGTIKFTPNANYHGPATVSYKMSDGKGGDAATVQVTVTPVNDLPIAADDVATVDEDSSIDLDVKVNDDDLDGDALTVTEATATNGTATINADGTIKFTPVANFNGDTTVYYTISDGNGGTDTATVAVTVTPVNDAPVAVNDAKTTQEDAPVTINAKANDTDIDGDTLHVSGVTQGTSGSVVINPDGTVTYSPNANFNGTDTFTYTISDGNGGSDATVTVTINSVNDAPVAADDAATVAEDDSVDINVKTNDTDVDGDTLEVTAATATHGTATINADGTVKFTPAANYNGPAVVSYTVSDGNGGTDTAEAKVTVTAVNDAPVAAGQTVDTNEDTALGGAVEATDIDGDALTYRVISGPSHGTLTLDTDGSFIYTPAANYFGADSFTYKAKDGNADSNEETVNITVTSVNDAPVAADDAAATASVTAVSGNVLTNDTDTEGAQLTAALVSQPANGTVTLNSSGNFTYMPAVGFSGVDSFTYRANDGQATSNLSNVATVKIAVTQPATTIGDEVTGGGTITAANGAAGGVSSFTLNVQSDDKLGSLKGKVEYGGSGEGIFIRSTAITGLVIDGNTARIFGKATVNGAGSYDFVADVVDNGEPGNTDTFRISVSNGYTNGPKALAGGNLQVHK